MKKIVIMGATSGIGRSLARECVRAGWDVGVAGRREEELKRLKEESPEHVHYEVIDVTKDGAEQALGQLITKIGGMDIYFHSSGVGAQNHDLDCEIEKNTITTNVSGFTTMIDAAYRYFKANGGKGHIGAITSIAGVKGLGVAASYSASKRFQNTYLDAVDQLAHIQGVDIKITDIRPGFVKTNLLSDGHSYPMLLDSEKVGAAIFKALKRGRRVKIVDWKYAILVFFWRMIPRCVWSRLKIKTTR